MEQQQGTAQAPITEAEFVSLYGELPVARPDLPVQISINTALAMEQRACPASEEKRTDETARLQKLAEFVGHEALLPEHRWLLSQNTNE